MGKSANRQALRAFAEWAKRQENDSEIPKMGVSGMVDMYLQSFDVPEDEPVDTLGRQVNALECAERRWRSIAKEILASIKVNMERGALMAKPDVADKWAGLVNGWTKTIGVFDK